MKGNFTKGTHKNNNFNNKKEKKMKKKYLFALLGLAFSNVAAATTFEAKCLNAKGKFSDCKIIVDTDALKVEYKSKKEKELNVTIPADKITGLSAGEYAKLRVAAAIFLSPLALLNKKKMEQVGVEYLNEAGKPKSVVFQTNKKYGMPLKTELRAFSGKVIQEESKEK